MPRIRPERRYFSMPSVDDGRRRRRVAQEVRLELVAVDPVVDPLPRCGDPLPGRDRGGAVDDGDRIAMAPCLDPEHAEPIVRVVVADVLD